MAERNNLITRPDDAVDERSTEELRRDIAARRESITETVDKLSERVQRTLDWRAYVAEHPVAALGIAVGAGFLIAGIFKPRPTPGERIMEALSETVEDLGDRFRRQLEGLPTQRVGPGRTIKAAAIAMVTKSVTDYLSNQLRDTYTARSPATAATAAASAEPPRGEVRLPSLRSAAT